jgi:small GTP-binding protein
MPPGQERYQSITNRFYAETKAVVIVYDIVNEESWSDVDFWVRELNYYLPAELDNGIPVLFVGNKRDLVDKRDEEQKVVNFRQVQEVANAYGFLSPVEVSAKTGHGVDKAFMRIVKHLLKHNSPKDSKPPGGPKIPQPPGSGCCSIA